MTLIQRFLIPSSIVCLLAPGALAKDMQQARGERDGKVRDLRDGTVYKTVTFDGQRWMARNLNYKTGNSWCYDNRPDNCRKYGRLYDWKTALHACPEGWHLPSAGELKIGHGIKADVNESVNAPSQRVVLLSRSYGGMDTYGFNAIPVGFRSSDGKFCDFGSIATFWYSSKTDDQFAHCLKLYVRQLRGRDWIELEPDFHISSGLSVRCVEDPS